MSFMPMASTIWYGSIRWPSWKTRMRSAACRSDCTTLGLARVRMISSISASGDAQRALGQRAAVELLGVMDDDRVPALADGLQDAPDLLAHLRVGAAAAVGR